MEENFAVEGVNYRDTLGLLQNEIFLFFRTGKKIFLATSENIRTCKMLTRLWFSDHHQKGNCWKARRTEFLYLSQTFLLWTWEKPLWIHFFWLTAIQNGQFWLKRLKLEIGFQRNFTASWWYWWKSHILKAAIYFQQE